MSLLLLLGAFCLLLVAGVPIFLALAIPGLGYALLSGLPISTAAYAMLQALSSFPLAAAPLFILLGAMANELGETTRIYDFARRVMRGQRGYSARLNVLVSMIFSGVSGSAIADIGGLGQIEVKAMEREGFRRPYAAALSAATSVVGPIFPPSIPLIIYAATAQVPALDALVAGVLPALLIGFLLYLFVVLQIRTKLEPAAAVADLEVDGDDGLGRSFLSALPGMVLAPFIVGAMLSGIMTPSEVGAFAVLYLFVVGACRRELSAALLLRCLAGTYRTTAGILVIVGAAAIFSRALTLERFPQLATDWFLQLSDDPTVILLVINFLVLLVGLFMETIAALLILTPVLLGVAGSIGLDPIHLGVILVFNLTIGLFTPPLGVGIFTISQAVGVRPELVFREMVPLYLPLLAALLVVTFVPVLSTALL